MQDVFRGLHKWFVLLRLSTVVLSLLFSHEGEKGKEQTEFRCPNLDAYCMDRDDLCQMGYTRPKEGEACTEEWIPPA